MNEEAIPTNSNPRYRWSLIGIFFSFMLLHQSDKLLIGPLTTPIMEAFGIDEVQMGAVFTGALLVGAVMYPVWGYLYDRYSRPKLLALASLIWGSTTWLGAIAPTYSTFLASRASTGIDDSSYPGLYSLVSDYFGPHLRGRVYGLLQLSQPLGYMLGLILATTLTGMVGWRGVFYLTGSLGVVLALVIFLAVRDVPRGSAEPELAELEELSTYRFDKEAALGLLRKPTLLFLFAQGFVGVFPWNVITYWFFRYLETERNYNSGQVLTTMSAAIAVLSAGYFVGGAAGDFFFRRTRRGRLLVAMVAVLVGAVLMTITMRIPIESTGPFLGMLAITALFIPFASPNVLSTVQDVAPPEVRSTAMSIQYFFDSGGAALAPLLAGWIAVRSSLGNAILVVSVSAWLLTALLLAGAAYFVPRDIAALRNQLALRAAREHELPPTATQP
ncbi:MAG: MFS transporter [Anaerolineales bacterium]